ncbi:DUF1775 domain-containing protein [Dactylosporangium vinaceum]|uniref:DUF1775 domain-containing protein n=1 Tax=Dactylosporangium vinaceum TaxID=53362 RepID=A0ABV5M8D3_9ACTN|nr:DUF1775 domain-containing protein [Dactylosporangium vinaceum]UAB94221.1 DUF1775 domain-containing protein [Dactylosporangium vinaceum]
MEYNQDQSRRRPRWAVRAAIAGAGALALLGVAAPAAADVTVTPTEAVQGDGADVTFRVTNDSRTASITEIDVQMPLDSPIAEVYPLSVDDWAPAMTNVQVDKPLESLHGYQITEVTTGVKWIAVEGRALPPGATTELFLSIGPLPKTQQLLFAVTLQHSDGTQVRMTGQPGESPAPALTLKAAPAGQGGHAAAHGGADANAAPAAEVDDAGDDPAGGTSYLTWSLVALLFIAAIAVVSVVLQNRRTPAPAAAPTDVEEPAESDSQDADKTMATTP